MSETIVRSPRKRIAYIDILEVLAIFLVVYCHFSNTKGDSIPAHLIQLCSFTLVVPLFLMANGALLFHHSFDLKKHIKRTVQLLIAVTVWRILYYIITDLICVISGMILLFSAGKTVSQVLGSVGIGTIITAFFMGPLVSWFSEHLARPLRYGTTVR